MPLLSQKTKEIWHVSYDSHQLLQMHQSKHSFRLYHSLVWLLLCPRPQGTTKGRECRPIHRTNQPPIDSVYTSSCLGKAASTIKDPTHPGHSLFHLLLLRKKIQKSEVTYQPASSLLPSQTFKSRLFSEFKFHHLPWWDSNPGPQSIILDLWPCQRYS